MPRRSKRLWHLTFPTAAVRTIPATISPASVANAGRFVAKRAAHNRRPGSQLDIVGQAFWRRRRILYQRHGIVFHSFLMRRGLDFAGFFFFALSHAINRVIGCDAINPSPKIRSRFKFSKLLVSAQKRLLDHFFGVGPVSRHAESQPENVVAMPLDENAKGISIASERAFHGDGVAVDDGLGVLDARLHSNH